MSVGQGNGTEGGGLPPPQWRVVMAEAEDGDAPRKALAIHPCASYFEAQELVRTIIGQRAITYTRYTEPIAHSSDEEGWLRAEAIMASAYSPAPLSRIVQVEYLRGADAPADLFTVPKGTGVCWRCGDPLTTGRGAYCPPCRGVRRRIYQNWWKASHRA